MQVTHRWCSLRLVEDIELFVFVHNQLVENAGGPAFVQITVAALPEANYYYYYDYSSGNIYNGELRPEVEISSGLVIQVSLNRTSG